jgi:U3 small nucleolar RNA-associated protein 23
VDDSNMGVQKHELSQQALAELAQLQRGPREKSIFRRVKAKGPNPLSIKKKKRGLPDQTQKQGSEQDAVRPKKKRVRKRNKEESN